jgi:hypothetical protein
MVGEVWFYQLSDIRVVLKGRVEGLGKYIFTNLEIARLQVLNDPIRKFRYYPNASDRI